MVFKKRQSATLEKAQARLRGLQSVNPMMDLGNGLTLQGYAALLETSSAQLQTHNLTLAEADRTRIEFAQAEASVSALSSRILSAVAAMYGKDSKEYEMAGGKPPGNYKRTKKQVTAIDPATPQAGSSSTPPSNQAATNGATANSAAMNGSSTSASVS
jgi:hypothetical protein